MGIDLQLADALLEVSSLLAVTHGAYMTYDFYKRTQEHTFASTWRCKENKLDTSSPVLVDMFLFSDSSATDRYIDVHSCYPVVGLWRLTPCVLSTGCTTLNSMLCNYLQ